MTLYLVIPQHEDILVSKEHLEGIDSSFLSKHLHLLLHLLTPPRHRHVEGVVATDLWVGPPSPSVVLLEQRLVLRAEHKVD